MVCVIGACSGKTCELFALCKIVNDKPECVCPTAEGCPLSVSPVCATNGKTYKNECLMKVDSCARKRGIFAISNGTCSKWNDT